MPTSLESKRCLLDLIDYTVSGAGLSANAT